MQEGQPEEPEHPAPEPVGSLAPGQGGSVRGQRSVGHQPIIVPLGIQFLFGRFAVKMLQLSRITRLARAAALAAGFLVVTGSFGLHPEPDSGSPASTENHWAASEASAEATPHACLACLAHRAVPLLRLNAGGLAPRPASP